MWRALYCYLSGQHDYKVTCEPGAIFLRCRSCGQRSTGWELHAHLAREQASRPMLARADARPVERHAA